MIPRSYLKPVLLLSPFWCYFTFPLSAAMPAESSGSPMHVTEIGKTIIVQPAILEERQLAGEPNPQTKESKN